jgi:hypothetical protein
VRDIDELRRSVRIRDARSEDDADPELNADDAADDGLVAEDEDEDDG